MSAELELLLEEQRKQGVESRQTADLVRMYRSCLKSRHPGSQEMARRYEQELRQLVGLVGPGKVGPSRVVVVDDSAG
jgi:hypothetical protein